MDAVIPGAEPMSANGNSVGVLFVHGYTGSPSSMLPLATAAAGSGYTVELPRLSGHGTSVDDLMKTSWGDWTSDVQAAHDELRQRVDQLVVVALSAGGAWASWLALRRRLDALMLVNPFVVPLADDVIDQILAAIEAGVEIAPGEPPDISRPCDDEVSYHGTPLRPLLTIQEALGDLAPLLGEIDIPVLLATSPQDHVIDPMNSEVFASSVAGPVKRLTLHDSFHVATQDHDQEVLINEMLSFIKEVTS